MLSPLPTSDMISSITASASAVSSTVASFFNAAGFDPKTLLLLPTPVFVGIENVINHLIENYPSLFTWSGKKGTFTVLIATILGVFIEVLAGVALGWDIKSAVITGLGIGLQAILYHDITTSKPQ